MHQTPFAPTYGETKTLTAGVASTSATIITKQYNLLVANAGSVVIFVKTGRTSVTATSGDMPILPGESRVLRMGSDHDTVAVLAASSTATVYVNPGTGQ